LPSDTWFPLEDFAFWKTLTPAKQGIDAATSQRKERRDPNYYFTIARLVNVSTEGTMYLFLRWDSVCEGRMNPCVSSQIGSPEKKTLFDDLHPFQLFKISAEVREINDFDSWYVACFLPLFRCVVSPIHCKNGIRNIQLDKVI
jgi:hypothetical protein